MYTSAALTEHRHRTRMCSHGLTYFHQSADSCVFFYGTSKFPFILKESMKIQQQPPPPSALPCYDKTLSHCISLHQGYFTLSGTLRLRHSLSCLWTSWGKGSWPPLPAWSLFLLWTFHKKKKNPCSWVLNRDLHLSWKFRSKEGAPSGVNWPFTIMKYYCFTLANKS